MKRLLLLALALLPTTASAAGTFSHAALTQVLTKYVNRQGRIDYKGLQADRAGLDAYVASLAAVSPDNAPSSFPTRADQLAYWLNAYNAAAITGVINRPGLTSVKSVELAFFATTTYSFGGKKASLNTVETDYVRKRFNDARIHMALNCQSAGCPRLRQDAYEAATLETQLDAGAKEFCADPAKVWVDQQDVWHLSQIFEWYKADFSAYGGPIGFINRFGGTIPTNAKTETIPYDWTLSAQTGRGP